MENGKEGAFACASQGGYQQGLSKREYFAGLAMQGLLAKEGVWSSDEILAKRSVEIADELLKQLEQ